MEIFSVFIEKPDGAGQAIALRFNQPSDDRQYVRQRRSSKNQL
jgi:hypothetical protein